MVKEMMREPGRTFQEYSVLPGLTKSGCVIKNIDLETDLAGVVLKIPLLSAAMTSVTGYDMALALGKEGGIGVLPVRLSVEEQVAMIRRIKNYEMGFVEEPVTVREISTIEDALRLIEQHGHSTVPVVDRNNTFLGMFTLEHYLETECKPRDKVIKGMVGREDVLYRRNPSISVDQAKRVLKKNQSKSLAVLDSQYRLQKLAFKKDIEKIKIASSISTYKGWKDVVDATVEAGVDLIVVDTSDAYSDFARNLIRQYKRMKTGVPLCAGNIVTYDGAMFLMANGADIVKVGMSSGSICITQREKAVGRAPMSALMDADRARHDFYEKTGRYIPLVADGGITSAADMVVALSLADAVMLGGYLNKFYEAAGEKLDADHKETSVESEIEWVATWGEGSARAKNLDRYGHTSRKTFFEEGVEGFVPYVGRLKPHVKRDMLKIKAALSNVGAMDLDDFRDKAVLELMSPFSSAVVNSSHNVQEKR